MLDREDDATSLCDATAGVRSGMEAYLSRFSNKSVGFYINGGNAGDALIGAGTLQCLKKLSIDHTLLTEASPLYEGPVLFGGGGNLVSYYKYIARGFEKYLPHAEEMILLPHTIHGHEALLGRMDQRVTLFCRDLASYAHCKAFAPNAKVECGHDMAFHLDLLDFVDNPTLKDRYSSLFEEKIKNIPSYHDKIQTASPLHFMRGDIEKCLWGIDSDCDISVLFMEHLVSHENTERSAWLFARTIAPCTRIVTDRLHVGIAASMLGIDCTLYDNIYGKISQVYDFSMKNHFPSTHMAR